MEKAAAAKPTEGTPAGSDPQEGPDVLEAKQITVQKNLEAASAKLSAARLGETLERDQQSEKLEVIDQPTLNREPISPNRPKIAGIVAVLALMAGAGIAGIAELLDSAIRRGSDLFSVVDSQLVVSIPYISTLSELRRRKIRIWSAVIILLLILVAAVVAAIWLLPPIDLLIAKARVGLFR